VVFWGDRLCARDFRTMSEAVCGSCFNTPMNPQQYYRVQCDNRTGTVSLDAECDAACSVCNTLSGVRTYSLNTCSPDLGNGFMQVTGVVPCDAYVRLMYNGSQDCSGAPTYTAVNSQYSCNFGNRFSCANAPSLRLLPRSVPDVRRTECHNGNIGFCGGPNCTSRVFQANACTAFPVQTWFNGNTQPATWRKVSCATTSQRCATLISFNGSGCVTTNFNTLWTIPCGVCQQNPGPGPNNYFLLDCSGTGQVTMKASCSPGCGSCQRSQSLQNQVCAADSLRTTSASILTRGVQPCLTVNVAEYSQAGCSGTLFANFTLADGACESGVKYECGDFGASPLPAANTTGGEHHKIALGLEIGLGALGVLLLVAVIAFMVCSRSKSDAAGGRSRNLQESDMEEPMYEQYREGGGTD